MRVEWDHVSVADDYLRAALAGMAAVIATGSRPLVDVREEDLRAGLCLALAKDLPGHVRREQALELAAFRGVGPFDVLVDRSPGRPVVWLAEIKWSYTTRSKIFEAVWDAVKLCVAARSYGTRRSWLITGAPNQQWGTAEARQLFADGTISFRELWEEPLVPPGPNGGKTCGEDALAGGRGNRFTCTPSAFAVKTVAREDLRVGGENWSIRAVALTAARAVDRGLRTRADVPTDHPPELAGR